MFKEVVGFTTFFYLFMVFAADPADGDPIYLVPAIALISFLGIGLANILGF